MASLPYYWEREDVRVIHYGLYPGVPLADVPEDVLAGTTSGEKRLKERFGDQHWSDFYTDDKPVVFGHHVVGEKPLVIRDRIFGIDTGACHGQCLTGLLLPELRLISVPAREDHWARVRKAWQAPVLRALDWRQMTFEQIQKKVRSLRDPELGDEVLDRIAAWSNNLLANIPMLREKLDAEMERIAGDDFGRLAAAHSAGSWMLRRHAGRLSPERLGCSTPDQLIALARALGVSLEEHPV
jgi:serine/threonine protein phosphatase 1